MRALPADFSCGAPEHTTQGGGGLPRLATPPPREPVGCSRLLWLLGLGRCGAWGRHSLGGEWRNSADGTVLP